jgi:hypothetical protein
MPDLSGENSCSGVNSRQNSNKNLTITMKITITNSCSSLRDYVLGPATAASTRPVRWRAGWLPINPSQFSSPRVGLSPLLTPPNISQRLPINQMIVRRAGLRVEKLTRPQVARFLASPKRRRKSPGSDNLLSPGKNH